MTDPAAPGPPHRPAGRDRTPGDRSERWRSSYRRVRKELLRSNRATNRARLRRLGVDRLGPDAPVAEIGAGDGNLLAALQDLGLRCVIGVEPQHDLARDAPAPVVVGTADRLPLTTGSVEAVLFMDVLHHLTTVEMGWALAEAHRVLRPGGLLLTCEPASTRTRRLLGRLIECPGLRSVPFVADKRTMVEMERTTLEPFLDTEPRFARIVAGAGFRRLGGYRGLLHRLDRFERVQGGGGFSRADPGSSRSSGPVPRRAG